MRQRASYVPAITHHRASGQAIVRIDGHDHYLGPWKSVAARANYDRLTAEWLANGRCLPNPTAALAVSELILKFLTWADEFYAGSKEPAQLRMACGPLRKLYGTTPAGNFGPVALRAVREEMIRRGWVRRTVNDATRRVKTLFRWGVERELLPLDLYHGLQAVGGLKQGRTDAPDRAPVKPVADALVDPLEAHVSRQVWAIITIQRYSGARAGELFKLTPADIDRSNAVWVYRPQHHKTEWKGRQRAIYFGPKSQAAIAPFLLRPDDAPLFSPAEAEAERRQARSQARKTPTNQGNTPGSCRVRSPKRTPGRVYDIGSYRRAIARACDIAFPPPKDLRREHVGTGRKRRLETPKEHKQRIGPAPWARLTEWQQHHTWSPLQLRHAAATGIRREFGLEAAQIALGHSSARVTDAVYAERDQAKAVAVMAKIG